jgi:uncharacterized membrane protein YphA (DoxX/SURF4 family)
MKNAIERIDYLVIAFMQRWGVVALRISLAVIFIWFGILKPFGLSSAEPLVLSTVGFLPLLSPEQWLIVIGWWEVLIGVAFIFKKTTRIAIILLAGQMVGTFMPLFVLPSVTFQAGHLPWAPTLEGQYIVKNLLIISAAMVVGGTLRKKEETD